MITLPTHGAARCRSTVRGAVGLEKGLGLAFRHALGVALVVLGGGLVAFHAVLLWRRVASFTLLEPWVALRWAVSVLILMGLFRLRRAGVPVFWGRKALIIWLTVLLLHLGSVLPGASDVDLTAGLGPANAFLFILPAPATLAFAVGLALGLAAALLSGSAPGLPKRTAWRRIGPFRRATLLACCPNLLSRPPPA